MEGDGVYRCAIVLAPGRPEADAAVRVRPHVTAVYGSKLPSTVGRAVDRLNMQRQLLREARQQRRREKEAE
jgi:hypothetical protein